jgi:hypothetical protein
MQGRHRDRPDWFCCSPGRGLLRRRSRRHVERRFAHAGKKIGKLRKNANPKRPQHGQEH